MRINRFFTEHGVCSRREADRWVDEGRIAINGVKAKHGDRLKEGDVVSVDGKDIIVDTKKEVIIAYNKPVGVECTSDPAVENNIIDAVNYPERIFHVGRLDKMSEGLILLTNQGDIVNKILRRRYGHEKEYIVVVDLPIADAQIRHLGQGVELDDGITQKCTVSRLGGRRVRMVLTEGRNRQIRRMMEALGFKVVRLKRIRVMNITLGELGGGKWRHLTAAEREELFEALSHAKE